MVPLRLDIDRHLLRIARTTALLALSAWFVMAVAASTATAATVSTEGGAACSAIAENDAPSTPEVAGGCPLRGTATDFELGGAFGVMVSCDITLEGKINSAGATNGVWAINGTTGGCEANSTTPCAGAADAHASSSAVNSSGAFTANFCAVAFGLTNRCSGVAGTATEGAAHTYTAVFVHTNKCSNGVNSIQGTITQVIDVAHPKVEAS